MPTDMRAAELNRQLVDAMVLDNVIRQPFIEAAFRAVLRHRFIPRHTFYSDADWLDAAYTDEPVPIKFDEHGYVISSSSQPRTMAMMLEQLDVRPGQRVLEIGTGTGYNAAVIAHLVGETGSITTIELDADLTELARGNLMSERLTNVQVVHADGSDGLPDHAPYDRIIVTAGAMDIPHTWIDQLAMDGRLVLPLSILGSMFSVALHRAGRCLDSDAVEEARFVPLRGKTTEDEIMSVVLYPDSLVMRCRARMPVSPEAIRLALSTWGEELWLPVQQPEQWREQYHLKFWLIAHDVRACEFQVRTDATQAFWISPFLGIAGREYIAVGLTDGQRLAFLGTAPETGGDGSQLTVTRLPGAADLAERLIMLVKQWEAAGRPSADKLCIRACPHSVVLRTQADELVIVKPSVNLILAWRDHPC